MAAFKHPAWPVFRNWFEDRYGFKPSRLDRDRSDWHAFAAGWEFCQANKIADAQDRRNKTVTRILKGTA